MEVLTRSAVEVSESLAGFTLGSYLHQIKNSDPLFERRLQHVRTGKFSVADLYYQPSNIAIEVKSVAHGNAALKGVIQASMYKEQTDHAIFCMEKPRRRAMAEGIESFAESHGVGVIWLVGIPTMCSESTIKRVTGGNPKPFQTWKQRRYTSTKRAIVNRSSSHLAEEFIDTFEQVVKENHEDIFEFSVKPDATIGGFADIYQ